MSATTKIKWRRALAKLRFSYEEQKLIEEISHATAQEFQEYYENFCLGRNINISHLNNKHRERVAELYNIEKTIPDNQNSREAQIDPVDDTSITLHKNVTQERRDKEKYQMTADEVAIHEAFSKLFKRIALKIHPDKLRDNLPNEEKEMMISMFQKANKSFDEKKYYILLDIASQLNIQTPKNYEQQIRWMKKEIETIEHEMKKQRNSYNFLFSETESDEERDHLVRAFIAQVFQMYVD